MDPEFSRLISEAADIAASGRWATLNVRIEDLCKAPGTGNEWWVGLFACLCSQIFREYLDLKNAYESPRDGDSSHLAWRARNLLELSIWSTYCMQNQDNARRFFEDAGRDERDIFDAFLKWGTTTAQPADWLDPLAEAKRDLSERASRLESIDSLEGRFLDVRDAAKDCGLLAHFSLEFKMLSKFAHPTSMQILAQPDQKREALQRDSFFSQGCLFFTGAFNALETALRDGPGPKGMPVAKS